MTESLSVAALAVTTLAQNGDVGAIVGLVVQLAIVAVVVAGLWMVFAKAGHPGWAAIIPIYNTYIMTKIAGRPWWWVILMFIPLVNIVIAILLMVDIAKAFGKGIGFAVGLILLSPIFFCILGFGSAQYQGPPAH